MEAAREGRREQLEILERLLSGEENVVFTNHQGKEFEFTHDPDVFTNDRVPVKVDFVPKYKFLDAVQTDRELAEKLVADGVDVNEGNEEGLTALHQSCIENNIPMATLLLENGADPNARDNDCWTPLHAAAACGNWRLCKKLLAMGADPCAVNGDMELPLDLADGDKVEAMLDAALTEAGYDDDDKRQELRDSPHVLLTQEIDRRIAAKEDLNTKNEQGATLLHIATCHGYQAEVEKLLSAMADTEVKDAEGHTALHMAAYFQQVKIVELLCKHEADLDARNVYNEPPINLTEDITMIRILQMMAQKKTASTSSLGVVNQPRDRTSSVNKRRTLQKQSLAKLDVQAEHKKIESAYAELSFPRGKPSSKSSSKEGSPKKPEQSVSPKGSAAQSPTNTIDPKGTVYSSIDHDAIPDAAAANQAVYATPEKKAPPMLPEKQKAGDRKHEKSATARKMDSMIAVKGRRPTAFDEEIQAQEAKQKKKKKKGCVIS
eukprot:m.124563 g.124563  ORF g.124563 m.124563 type:complete len:490 (+) comp16623_c0_seq1:146-1615(+)